MTSMHTILIAPHRPALGFTTHSLSPCHLLPLPPTQVVRAAGGGSPPLGCHWDVSKDH